MPWDLFNEEAMQLLQKSLQWQSRRHEVIGGNIANLDTPRYTRKDLDFRKVLNGYLQGRPEFHLANTNPRHLHISPPGVAGLVEDTGRDVDLDQEMVEMSRNQLNYQASVQMLIKKIDSLKSVIEGGR